jgi:uncharacterized membrane protein
MNIRSIFMRLFMPPCMVRWYIAFCLIFGIPLIFLYPPFLASDEIAHFYRAYQVSEFRLTSEAREHESGGMLPSSLSETTGAFRGNMFAVPDFTLDLINDIPRLPLAPNDRVWTEFTGAALYSPLPYIPQAIGLLIGRLLSLTPLTLLYIGRICSLLTWAFMGAYALKITPFYRNVLFILLLTPLVFSKAVVLTADVVTVGACSLLVCQILKIAFGEKNADNRDIILMFGLAVLVGLCKISYAPLAALCFMIPAARLGGRKRYFIICGSAVFLALVVNLLWTGFLVANQPLQSGSQAQPGVQVRYMLSHPFAFIRVVLRYTYNNWLTIIRAIFGEVIVWREVWLPIWVIVALWASVILATVTDRKPVVIQMWKRAGILAVALCTYVVIIASLYVSFTSPMLDRVQGMQPRYMYPLLLPLLIVLKHNKVVKFDTSAVYLPVTGVSLTVLIAAMYARFV